jgi:hypothetical protein
MHFIFNLYLKVTGLRIGKTCDRPVLTCVIASWIVRKGDEIRLSTEISFMGRTAG